MFDLGVLSKARKKILQKSSLSLYVCVCVCVRERERERDRQTERYEEREQSAFALVLQIRKKPYMKNHPINTTIDYIHSNIYV